MPGLKSVMSAWHIVRVGCDLTRVWCLVGDRAVLDESGVNDKVAAILFSLD